ncbi:MAG: mechanosensitive ion channel family protein [Halodesulfovibrio sp.]
MEELFTQYKDLVIIWAAKNGTNIIVALVIFIVGHWLAKRISHLLQKGMQHKAMDMLLINFIKGVVYYAIMAAVFIAVAAQVGIDTTSFLAILGSVGLAVGLAMKDNLSNFSSGVMLVLFRPFTFGDFVSIAGVSGSVVAINLFHTELKSPDNQRIIIPNSLIMGQVITNVTGNATRRIDMVFGIGYGDDIAKARDVIIAALESEAKVLKDPAYTVAVSELADSSVNFVVRPWVATGDYWDVRFRLTESIKLALEANGISIPFPQRDVHIIQTQA